MKNYKITIQYDGSRYSGWQKQGNTKNTIQGKIEDVLSKMTQEEIEIHGSGRTDAGVHALAQVANFKTTKVYKTDEIFTCLNTYLPQDIRVLTVAECAPRFHARLNAVRKHYRYIVNCNAICDVFSRKYVTHLPGTYDIDAMKEAADALIGTHDFKSFCENKRMKKSTVRTIDSIEITEENGILSFDFYGDGFLYHMVRILTGTLLEVGSHKRSADSIAEIIERKERPCAGFTAPPQGLFLVEVDY